MFSISLKGSWYFIPLRTTCPNMHQEQAQQEKKNIIQTASTWVSSLFNKTATTKFAIFKSKEKYQFLSLSQKQLVEEDEDAVSWSHWRVLTPESCTDAVD